MTTEEQTEHREEPKEPQETLPTWEDLQRHWHLCVAALIAILAFGVAGVAARQLPPTYGATAILIASNQTLAESNETYAALDDTDPRVSVRNPQNTLNLVYTTEGWDTPEAAIVAANTAALGYLATPDKRGNFDMRLARESRATPARWYLTALNWAIIAFGLGLALTYMPSLLHLFTRLLHRWAEEPVTQLWPNKEWLGDWPRRRRSTWQPSHERRPGDHLETYCSWPSSLF